MSTKETKRKRGLSLADLVSKPKTETKKEEEIFEEKKDKCPTVDITKDVACIRTDMARVTTQLETLQASIGRLLDICLQEGPEEYSDEGEGQSYR